MRDDLGFWRVAAANPERVAVVDEDGTEITYGELLAQARGVARGLYDLGLRRGDSVAAVLPNRPAFFAVLFAAMESGLYFTPVNSHLAAPEIEHVIVDSEAGAVITHPSLVGVVGAAADAAGYPPERRFVVGDAVEGFRSFADLLAGGTEPVPERSPGVQMMYTSGTTGKPKGVRRHLPEGDPDDVFGTIAEITCRGFGVPVGPEGHLVCGPLYHAGPFVGAVNALHVGARVVLVDRWTPERFLELVERHHIASTQMVPTMFHRLLALPPEVRARYDVSSLRSVFHTGAPCPRAVKQQIMDWWGPVVYETYGGTEGAATIATPKRWLERPGTVGKAIHGVTVHILDDDGNDVPTGEPGDIWIDTGGPPPEYFKDPAKTATMRKGNLVTLGDIGYLDADGYLFLCDRKVDMIISGGVNIYPAEVEAALLADPRVGDVAVIGIPDDEWGELVKAIVEPAAGVAPTEELPASLIEACRARIASFKCPRVVELVEALPRLPNGKVEKRRLRDAHWAHKETAI